MKKKKRKKRSTNKKNKKTPFIIFTILVFIAGGVFYYNYTNLNNSPEKSKVRQAISQSDPSFLRGGESKPTLSPARFTGKVANAYKVAEQNPVLLDSMYCYCNCKETIGHKSLLSCFVDGHAVSCGICQNQAFFALSQYQKNMNIIEVRKAVDAKFWRPLS